MYLFSHWWNQWSTFLFFFSLVTFLLNFSQSQCPTRWVRTEWRKQSPQQKSDHVRAVTSFYQGNVAAYRSFAQRHVQYGFSGIHGSSQFLPWHRAFILEYESYLRNYVPGVSQPYWDASADSASFPSAPVFAADAYGPLNDGCINIRGINIMDASNRVCSKRSSNNWRSYRVDNTILLNRLISLGNDFVSFSRDLEGGYHGQVHMACGGTMADYLSPLDPLFFLHHCQVDRLWALWQSKSFNPRLTTIGVTHPGQFNGLQFITSNLIGFTGRNIQSMMDISNLCYSYDDVNVKPGTPPPPKPPTPTPQPPNPQPRPTPPPPPPAPKPPVFPPNCISGVGIPQGHCFNRFTTPANLMRIVQSRNPTLIQRNWQILSRFATRVLRRRDGNGSEKVIDLGEIANVMTPTHLPESWIKLNQLDLTYVRNMEKEKTEVVDKLNHIPGFVAATTLLNNPDKIAKTLESLPPGTEVVFTVKGETMEVPLKSNCTSTVKDLVGYARKSEALTVPPPTKEELVAIVGEPVFCPIRSLVDPFKVCQNTKGPSAEAKDNVNAANETMETIAAASEAAETNELTSAKSVTPENNESTTAATETSEAKEPSATVKETTESKEATGAQEATEANGNGTTEEGVKETVEETREEK